MNSLSMMLVALAIGGHSLPYDDGPVRVEPGPEPKPEPDGSKWAPASTPEGAARKQAAAEKRQRKAAKRLREASRG